MGAAAGVVGIEGAQQNKNEAHQTGNRKAHTNVEKAKGV